MDYTTFHLPAGAEKVPETEVVTSLYETLHQLSDARRCQGKRYELALILCLLVLAKLAGETSLSGATEWSRHRAALLAEQFSLRRKSMPCQMTYCNILARVDAKQLDEILQAFFVRLRSPAALWSGTKPIAHASRTSGSRPSGYRWQTPWRDDFAATSGASTRDCYEVATGIVLWHCDVQEKENEGSRAQAVVDPAVNHRAHFHPGCHAYATLALCADPPI